MAKVMAQQRFAPVVMRAEPGTVDGSPAARSLADAVHQASRGISAAADIQDLPVVIGDDPPQRGVLGKLARVSRGDGPVAGEPGWVVIEAQQGGQARR
jgi:hypothetical protein